MEKCSRSMQSLVHPQNPCRKIRNGSTHLQSLCCGDGDRRICLASHPNQTTFQVKTQGRDSKDKESEGTTRGWPMGSMCTCDLRVHIGARTQKIQHKNTLKKKRTLVLKRNCNLRCWKPPGSCDSPLDSSTPQNTPWLPERVELGFTAWNCILDSIQTSKALSAETAGSLSRNTGQKTYQAVGS